MTLRLKPHKYGARRTVVEGITFHSKAEALRYQELRLLEKAGEIRELELQPAYPILVKDRSGRAVLITVYLADFRYREGRDGVLRVEDVKGMISPIYKIKKKLVETLYGIEIREIKVPRGTR